MIGLAYHNFWFGRDCNRRPRRDVVSKYIKSTDFVQWNLGGALVINQERSPDGLVISNDEVGEFRGGMSLTIASTVRAELLGGMGLGAKGLGQDEEPCASNIIWWG